MHYQGYLRCRFKEVDQYFIKGLESACASGAIKVSSSDGTLYCAIEKQSWDSNVLAMPVGRIIDIIVLDDPSLESANKFIKKIDGVFRYKKISMASVRIGNVTPNLLYALQNNGWRVVDNLAIFNGPCTKSFRQPIQEGYKFGVVSVEKALEFHEKADDLFLYSRIYQDPKINNEMAKRFYFQLHETICKQHSSISVGLYYLNELVGIAIGAKDVNISDSFGVDFGCLWEIGLLSEFRGKGLSRSLLSEFLNRCQSVFNEIEIGTQINNIPSLRLYISLGLKPVTSAITLHRWFDE